MTSKLQLHKDSEDWLTICLDPFHDLQRTIEGMPDSIAQKSYVRIHNQTVNCSANADGDQFAVTFTGVHGITHAMSETIAPYPATGDQIGPISVIRGTSVVNPNFQNVCNGTCTMVQNFDTAFESTIPSRLISIGVEVHDVTAPLYKKGTLLVAPINGAWNQRIEKNQYTDATNLYFTTLRPPLIPTNYNLLQVTPGSETWSLSKGVYAVGKLYDPQPPKLLYDPSTARPMCLPLEYQEILLANGTIGVVYDWDDPASVTHDIQTALIGGVESGFQPFRIHITGVAAETELRVVVRTIVEYFPEMSSPSEAGIATQSPPFDPAAFMAYHEAARQLKIGVPVGMNAAGDYWRIAKQILRQVAVPMMTIAPPILASLGQPHLAAAVTAARAPVKALLKPKKKANRPRVRQLRRRGPRTR